jgi:hypothetical protein
MKPNDTVLGQSTMFGFAGSAQPTALKGSSHDWVIFDTASLDDMKKSRKIRKFLLLVLLCVAVNGLPLGFAADVPETMATCKQQGGVWDRFGLLEKEECSMRTRDAGSACTTDTQCHSVCITDDSAEKGSRVTGRCFARTMTRGTCLNYVKDGIAQGQVCVD